MFFDIRVAAAALNGESAGRDRVVCPGPGHSASDRSLSVLFVGDRFVVKSFAGDDPLVCLDHVRFCLRLPPFRPGERDRPSSIRTAFRRVAPGRDNAATAASLWRQALPLADTMGEIYLRSIRGISCALPDTMRFKPASGLHLAAIVTAFGFPAEPEPGVIDVARMSVLAVHRTLLSPDGTKVDKRFLGSPKGPLVVAPWTETGRGLVIAEGIEDALSGHEATGLAAWAAGSAGQLPKLAPLVPDHVESVWLMEDNDDAGRRATIELADALHSRGFEVLRWQAPR